MFSFLLSVVDKYNKSYCYSNTISFVMMCGNHGAYLELLRSGLSYFTKPDDYFIHSSDKEKYENAKRNFKSEMSIISFRVANLSNYSVPSQHIIKAHTALKNEYVNDTNQHRLTPFEVQFLQAYKEFTQGEPNDLHNLIFPIAKGAQGNWVFSFLPDGNASTAINKISKILRKLFKPDHIKSLVVALIDTTVDRKFALELLDMMGLSKWSHDNAAKTIQRAYKKHTRLKNQQPASARPVPVNNQQVPQSMEDPD